MRNGDWERSPLRVMEVGAQVAVQRVDRAQLMTVSSLLPACPPPQRSLTW
ncbi:hypothetical protein JOM49_002053 [Amycolatopsis magusensis]|uniref:Uncharacterized protein n=1 Tax=Amycolatopsis magusensis TaxID=882444 RepID=A0ABS4PM76_9PSEU|nr:hypothetical protein [Amycolatopsis magusensis]